MIKSLAVAAALTIGLAGYAFAQNTITGAPAGTAPETPAPGTPAPIPGLMPPAPGTPAQMGSDMHHHHHHYHHHHHMHHHEAAPMAAPAEAPK
jgi:hypothetical protein